MAKIEGFRVKNFKVLKDVTLGRLWNLQKKKPLTAMTAVIGKNGVGKSALFDAFGFLADALKSGVEEACDQRSRGGFERLRSQGETAPIEFEVYYREHGNARPITYQIAIQADEVGRPYVLRERLRQRRKGQKHGQPFSFLFLENGKGVAWKGGQAGRQIDEEMEQLDLTKLIELITAEESSETEIVELEDSAQARHRHARRSETASENRRLSPVYRGMVSQLLLSRRGAQPAAGGAAAAPQHPWRQPRQCRAIYGARTSGAFQDYLGGNRG